MPSKSVQGEGASRTTEEVPILTPGTLENLTSKINNKLQNPSQVTVSRQASHKNNKTLQRESGFGRFTSRTKKEERSKTEGKTRDGDIGKHGISSSTGNGQASGRKRQRNGDFKPGLREERKTKEAGVSEVHLNGTDTRSLQSEIALLGGSKDDIELLQGIESESDIDGDVEAGAARTQSGADDELRKFVHRLGFEKVIQRDFTDDAESEGEQVTQDVDNGSEKKAKAITAGQSDVNTSEMEVPSSKGKKKTSLLYSARSDWHAADVLAVSVHTESAEAVPPAIIESVHQYAKVLLEKENEAYAANRKSNSSAHQFYTSLLANGTLSDKISALTLSIQESPVHTMKEMESLLALARKRSRDQAVNVLGALKDLFGPSNLLPSSRRLVEFDRQPGLSYFASSDSRKQWTLGSSLPSPITEMHLIHWAFEDWLKSIYFQVLKILESWCNDEVTFARIRAVEYISQLLRDKPEQEANLLRLLVNKLGDSDKKVASKTSFNILQVENTHPLMKPTIIGAVESDLLFRPGQSLHAQYYAAVTLNQTVLSAKEENVARTLLEIYFSLFLKLLADPNIAEQSKPVSESIKINKKGQIQGGGGPVGKKALAKQKKEQKSVAVEEDLREKLISAILTGVNRAVPYLSTTDEFFDTHLDTLFRVTHSSNFNTSIQALILIQQVSVSRLDSQDRFYRVLYESLLDPRLLMSSKQALYLNLLYRALKADINIERVKAFAKRLLQISSVHQPQFSCAILYMLRELETAFPALANVIDENEHGESDDDEEVFRDVVTDTTASPNLSNDTIAQTSDSNHTKRPYQRKYDPRKRDPAHALASEAPSWELATLTRHYHPSVTLFSTRLLEHGTMPPVPDLQQNTMIHFLDRFVFKNPKSSHVEKVKGISIMQPLAAGDKSSVLLSNYTNLSRGNQPVNSESFRRQESTKVSPNEVFFHQYFNQIGLSKDKAKQKRGKRGKKTKGDDSDNESDEEEIWKALVESKPDIEGNNSGFSDEDLDAEIPELAAALGEDTEDDVSMSDLDEDEGDSQAFPSDMDTDVSNDDIDDNADATQGGLEGVTSPPPTDGRSRKRKLKSLPTFVDADQYADMLRDDSE